MFMFVSDATLLTDLLPVFQDNAENAEARDSDKRKRKESRLLRKIRWILLPSKPLVCWTRKCSAFAWCFKILWNFSTA